MSEVAMLERVEELNEYIHNFPESRLVPIHQKEVNYLNALLAHDYKAAAFWRDKL